MNQLDNPLWYALVGEQARWSVGGNGAKRYRKGFPTWAAMPDAASSDTWSALAKLFQHGERVGLLAAHELIAPSGWLILGRAKMTQLVCTSDTFKCLKESKNMMYVRDLTASDSSAMVRLAEHAQLRPITDQTILLGRYIGAFDHNEDLIAIAGERARLCGMTEISAVCTHPAYRRRGLALMLAARITEHVLNRRDFAFLHIMDRMPLLTGLYGRIGYSIRSELNALLATRPDGSV